MVQFGGKFTKRAGMKNNRKFFVNIWDLRRLTAKLKAGNWEVNNRMPLKTWYMTHNSVENPVVSSLNLLSPLQALRFRMSIVKYVTIHYSSTKVDFQTLCFLAVVIQVTNTKMQEILKKASVHQIITMHISCLTFRKNIRSNKLIKNKQSGAVRIHWNTVVIYF